MPPYSQVSTEEPSRHNWVQWPGVSQIVLCCDKLHQSVAWISLSNTIWGLPLCSETILCLLHLCVPCIFPDCTILHPGRKCKPLVSLQLNQFLWWRLKSLNSFRVYSFRQIQRAIRHFIGWPRLNRFLVPIINCWSCGPYWRKIINLPSRQRTRSKPAFPRFLNLEPWSPPQSVESHPILNEPPLVHMVIVQDTVQNSSSFRQILPWT